MFKAPSLVNMAWYEGALKCGHMFVICVLLLSVQTAGSLECSSCTNVKSISDCHASTICGPNEHCFTYCDGIGPNANFSLGCRQLDQCGIHANSNTQPPAIVGRDVIIRASIDCQQCCNTDYCNRKLCIHSTDSHGGWTDWERWGTCSQTCGVGLMKRNRQCSQPYPGPLGNPCFGDYTDSKICLLKECPQVDGSWSSWTSWSTCSATCNGGLMSRGRICNNPKPSSQGNFCNGFNRDSQLCNMKKCPDPVVFFTVTTPKNVMVNNVAVFGTVKTHSGNEYSTSTGKFTCKVSGLYHFSVTFTSQLKTGTNTETYCYIRKNNANLVRAYNSAFGNFGSDNNWRSASASAYVSLVTGDRVDVGYCGGWKVIGYDDGFIFNGALISAS